MYSQVACNFEADNFLGVSGGRKNPKNTLFLTFFEGFSPITLVFLNRFTSKRSHNVCIARAHATQSMFFLIFWVRRASKIEKHPF